jgi:hypothetical protein
MSAWMKEKVKGKLPEDQRPRFERGQPLGAILWRQWDSIQEVKDANQTAAWLAAQGSCAWQSPQGYTDTRFYGPGGAARAKEIANWDTDWPEGREAYATAAEEVSGMVGTVKSRRRKRRYAIQGASLNLDRWQQYDPRPWVQRYREVSDGPGTHTIRVVINGAASCNVDAKDYVWSAVAAAIVASKLEEAGYSVEIVNVMAVNNMINRIDRKGKSQAVVSIIPIKAEEEPVDIDRVLRFCAHPGVYRTLGFHAWMTSPIGKGREGNGSLGYPWDASKAMKALGMDDGTVYAPHPNDCRTAKAAVEWLTKTLAPFGMEG